MSQISKHLNSQFHRIFYSNPKSKLRGTSEYLNCLKYFKNSEHSGFLNFLTLEFSNSQVNSNSSSAGNSDFLNSYSSNRRTSKFWIARNIWNSNSSDFQNNIQNPCDTVRTRTLKNSNLFVRRVPNGIPSCLLFRFLRVVLPVGVVVRQKARVLPWKTIHVCLSDLFRWKKIFHEFHDYLIKV